MFLNILSKILLGGFGDFMQTYKDIKVAEMKQSADKVKVVKELELARFEKEEQARQTAKDIRLATKDHWEIRFAIGIVVIPTSLHYAFTVLDSIYHFGWEVAPLPAPMDEWQATIILSYFGYGTFRHGANVLAARLLRK